MSGDPQRSQATPNSRPIVRRPLAAALLLAATALTPLACRNERPATAGGGAGATDEIPFQLAGVGESAIVVPTYIDGRGPFDLILDTGATLTCVDASLAEQLALPERFAQFGVGAGVEGVGRLRLVRIDSLRVGHAHATALSACVLDLKHLSLLSPSVRGLLGLNFLRDYRMTVDFERRILVLQRS